MVWTAISNKLNKYGPQKTKTQWAHCWRDMRSNALKKQNFIQPHKFSAEEQRILKLINSFDGPINDSDHDYQSENSAGEETIETTKTSILKSILDAPSTSEAKARLQQITAPQISTKKSVPSKKIAKSHNSIDNSSDPHQYLTFPPSLINSNPQDFILPGNIHLSESPLSNVFTSQDQDTDVIIQLKKIQETANSQLAVQTQILAELKKMNERQNNQLQLMSRLEQLALLAMPVSQENGEGLDDNINI